MAIFSFRTIFELIGWAIVILSNQESSITVRLLNPCMGTSISSRSELQRNITKDSCHVSIYNLRLTSHKVLSSATKLMHLVAARINDDELLSKLEGSPCFDGFPCIPNKDTTAPSVAMRRYNAQLHGSKLTHTSERMSQSGERSLPRYADVIMATAIPSQHEIALPYTDLDMESIIYQYNEEPDYANLNIRPPTWQTPPPSDLYDSSASISHDDVSEPPSPRTSHIAETLPITLLDPLHSSSRQCKFDIGEEWEAFQLRKAASCPSSPNHNIRSESKIFTISSNSELATNNVVQGPSSPRPSRKQNVEEVKEQFPLHLFLANQTVTVTPDYQINPNPYNRINQTFHSTLQCPCFLFFFFLCCLPGIYYMQRSDIKYKRGEKETARMLGRRATIFFATGSLVGIIFLTVSMFFAVEYVRQFVK